MIKSLSIFLLMMVFQGQAFGSNLCSKLFYGERFDLAPQSLQSSGSAKWGLLSMDLSLDRFGKRSYLANRDYFISSPFKNSVGLWDYPGGGKFGIKSWVVQVIVNGVGIRGRDHAIAVAMPLSFSSTIRLQIQDGILSALETLPKSRINLIQEIRVNTEEYINNDYFKERYVDYDRAAATGGDGVIDFFPTSIGDLRVGRSERIIQHEFGHVLASAIWGSVNPPEAYIRAAMRDGVQVSHYGANHWAEDWAEAIVEYIKWHQGQPLDRRAELSGRFGFIDRIYLPAITQKDEPVPSVNELRRKFLSGP